MWEKLHSSPIVILLRDRLSLFHATHNHKLDKYLADGTPVAKVLQTGSEN